MKIAVFGTPRLWVGAAVVSLVSVACGVAGADTGGQRTLESPADVSLVALTDSLPLAELVDKVVLDQSAHLVLENTIRACMLANGFEYEMMPYYVDDLIDVERRYGLVDEATAADLDRETTDGPPALPDVVGEGMNSAFSALDQVTRESWDAAFFGDAVVVIDLGGSYLERSSGGCLETGWEAAVGDVDAWHELFYRLQILLGDSYTLAESDPRVQEALGAWSACMKFAGYSVNTREDLAFVQGDDLWRSDARCNNTVGLASTWLGVEAEIQRTQMIERLPYLEELLAYTSLGAERR